MAPFGGGGGEAAAHVGAVHDVVVDEGGDVDHLEDDGETGVVFGHAAGGAAGEEGEGGADALARGFADVADVALDTGVESVGLLADGGLNDLHLRAHQVEGEDGDGGLAGVFEFGAHWGGQFEFLSLRVTD